MTKKQYFDRCKQFNWLYSFSDDFRVYSSGAASRRMLEEACMCFPEWKPIYDAWHRYYFSGKPWGIDKAKKPEYHDFEIEENK